MSESSISVQSASNYSENSLKEQKGNSSLFICLSYYLFETLIKLKSDREINKSFYENLNRVIESASAHVSTLDLNSNILISLQQMVAQIFDEPSPSIAFGYLRYYFGFINSDCFITLNYGMRLIIVGLLDEFPEIQISIINSTSFDWYKSIQVFVQAFKIQVALIQDHEKIVFPIFQNTSYFNVYLGQENEVFSVLCTENYSTLFENDPFFEKDDLEVSVLYLENELKNIFCSNFNQKNVIAELTNMVEENKSEDCEQFEFIGDRELKNVEQENPLISPSITNRRRRKMFRCTMAEFIKSMELVIRCFKLGEIFEEIIYNRFNEENAAKPISVKNIINILDQFLPERFYKLDYIKRLSREMHSVFSTSKLTRFERDEIILIVTQLKTCMISKKSCIKIIELLIKSFVSRKSMFNTVLRIESNRIN